MNAIGYPLAFAIGAACAMGCFYLGYMFGKEKGKKKRKPRAKKIKCDVIDLEELFDKNTKSA